jgi:hypothetical protein
MAPRLAKPSNAFLVGDYIKVVGKGSTNYGRTGVVKSVGKQCLTIDFDDGNPKGLWVDWRDARVVPRTTTLRPPTTEYIYRTPRAGETAPRVVEQVVHVQCEESPRGSNRQTHVNSPQNSGRRLQYNECSHRSQPAAAASNAHSIQRDDSWTDADDEHSADWHMDDNTRMEHRRANNNCSTFRFRGPEAQAIGTYDDVEDLSQLMEHMSFTAAMLISSHHRYPGTMEPVLESYTRAVRDKTTTMVANKVVFDNIDDDSHCQA